MASSAFSHVYLIGRPGVQGVAETLDATYAFLLTQKIDVTVENVTATLMQASPSCAEQDNLPDSIDLIIVVGGDGSLLNAAQIALEHDLCILGIHRGRLGFLTDIPPDELNKIAAVLKGEYIEEPRYTLSSQFTDNHGNQHQQLAINDVTLLPGDVVHMIEFETYADEKLIYNQRADGLIVASPTGSTAYALSGGGPILQPGVNALVLVPMFPHTLSSRPIVIDGEHTVRVHISQTNETSPFVSCDGRNKVSLELDSFFTVKKHSRRLRLIHPTDYCYFTLLREKLGWEKRARRT